jgi:hypothetical protein
MRKFVPSRANRRVSALLPYLMRTAMPTLARNASSEREASNKGL